MEPMKTTAVMRDDDIFTIAPWPAGVENPAKFRWMIYRDGTSVGAARTKAEGLERVNAGYYDREGK